MRFLGHVYRIHGTFGRMRKKLITLDPFITLNISFRLRWRGYSLINLSFNK
jgi:hypothetical protein